MSYFNTAKVHDNEVVKASDFEYGFQSFINNFSLGMKIIMQRDKNFVIGGKVKCSPSGGMNLCIEPIFSFCKTPSLDIIQGVGTDEIKDLVTVPDSTNQKRIDIVEVCGVIEEYDQQQRAVNDPETNIKTYPLLNTKQRVILKAQVKQGIPGSTQAPLTTEGWVKLAEVIVPVNATSIDENNIKNITADDINIDNVGWTNEKQSTINIGQISEINSRFRKSHNTDGTHKDNIIKVNNIDIGTNTEQLSAAKIPLGANFTVGNETLTMEQKLSVALKNFANQFNSVYEKYINKESYNFAFNGSLKLSNSKNQENDLLKPLEFGANGDGSAFCKIGDTNIFTITSDGKIRMNTNYDASNKKDLITKEVTDSLRTDLTTQTGRIDELFETSDNTVYTNNLLSRYTYVSNTITVATTQNITLSGTQIVDGVSLQVGNIILVKNQTNAKQNGIYECGTATWQRKPEFADFNDIKGKLFVILNGSSNKNKIFYTPQEHYLGDLGSENLIFSEYKKIETQQINNSVILTEKIADSAITTGKLANSSVTTEKIADSAITTAKIKEGTIEASDINKTSLLNLIYPVGAIYLSVNNVNPSTFLGGTWIQIKDKFLLGAGDTYSGGATGGSSTVTLTENQIPSHKHIDGTKRIWDSADGEYGVAKESTTKVLAPLARYTVNNNPANVIYDLDYTSSTGGGQSHNNMPPYLAVYIWKRTV